MSGENGEETVRTFVERYRLEQFSSTDATESVKEDAVEFKKVLRILTRSLTHYEEKSGQSSAGSRLDLCSLCLRLRNKPRLIIS